MANPKPPLSKTVQEFLETATQEEIKKKFYNGNDNPSATDWMLRVSKIQKDRDPVTEEEVKAKLEEIGASFYVFQLEEGEKTGYLHYQIFAQFKSRTRLERILKVFNRTDPVVWVNYAAPRMGSVVSCVEYCSKPETRKAPTVMEGSPDDYQTKVSLDTLIDRLSSNDNETLTDLLTSPKPEVQKAATLHGPKLRVLESAIKEKQLAHTERKVKVFYLYGDTQVGKSTLAREITGKDYYAVTSWKNPFDCYNYQTILVLEDWRDNQTKITEMLHWLDSQPLQLSCRYANKYAAWDTVFITSNVAPEHLYVCENRQDREALLARITEVWEVHETEVTCYETPQHVKAKALRHGEKQFNWIDPETGEVKERSSEEIKRLFN